MHCTNHTAAAAANLLLNVNLIKIWDPGREIVGNAWISADGRILEYVDEMTLDAENELLLDDYGPVVDEWLELEIDDDEWLELEIDDDDEFLALEGDDDFPSEI